MTQLYPIGTQLITRRLSQIDLYEELIDLNEIYSFLNEKWIKGFYREATKWRVTVTEENQKWLSPMPIVGDWIETFDGMIQVLESSGNDVGFERKGILYFYEDEPIVLRTYPNGQRAPMLEWDEVILPAEGTQS